MILRKARLSDVSEIVEMWKEFMKDHDDIITKDNHKHREYVRRKKDAEKLFSDYLKKSIESTNAFVSIAEIRGEPVGYNISFVKENIPVFDTGKLGLISDLFVKKNFRNNKISSMFKDQALMWFRKKGIKYAIIEVYETNKHARKVYENWGFTNQKIKMWKKL